MPGPDLRQTIEELAREVAGLDYAASQDALRSVYRLAWLNILQELDRTLRSGGRQPARLAQLLASVTQALRAADRSAAAWMSRFEPRKAAWTAERPPTRRG